MMVGHQGSQLERSQEPFRRSHSAYNPSTVSTTNGNTEPRFSGGNQSARYSSTAHAPSSGQSSASSASHPTTPPDTKPTEADDKTMTSSTSIPPTAEQSRNTPNARPQTSQQPLQNYLPSTSTISASAPTTAYSSPTRHRRPSSLHDATPQLPPLVRLRDLSQVVDIASQDQASGSQASDASASALGEPRYEISQMPVTDIIEMVAALLTKITTTNDRNHDNLQRSMPTSESTSTLPMQTTSVLAFHGKNVPTITIHSYLSRIHKYCPTTYEVFLSLLVYFDRMTELVNTGSNKLGKSSLTTASSSRSASRTSSSSTPNTEGPPTEALAEEVDEEASKVQNCFVVDSFNIHRLVIAGVTCASKFFSDVFYTNSRYAKVGGLPLVELNHLELQFLLLNDFRLSIPVEELEAYGTMLVQFYAREEKAKRRQAQAGATGGGE